jgi:hypothetical protein
MYYLNAINSIRDVQNIFTRKRFSSIVKVLVKLHLDVLDDTVVNRDQTSMKRLQGSLQDD